MTGPSGFLIVDKPVGATSFAMVKVVRRLTHVKRVGHAGTLDPLASGVLPIAVGQATRLIEYLDDELKIYVARVRFGVETDTYDADGTTVATRDASHLAEAGVRDALPAFVGDVEQTPPLYSAIKLAGTPLYRYAREGIDVTVAPRIVHIESIDLRSFDDGVAEIEVRCGKGTYIRSIAHDLGRRLGCGAHLAALRRTSSGGFTLADAHTPEELAASAAEERLDELMLAPDRAVERRLAAIFGEAHTTDILHGRDVTIPAPAGPDLCRVYTAEGQFLAVLRRGAAAVWHPEKVFQLA